MNTDFKVLIDECVQGELAARIKACSGIRNACHMGHGDLLPKSGMLDPDVVAYATKEDRILVTIETRLDEKKYAICTHPGIIVILARSTHERIKLFERFMLSGMRRECYHAVTKLRPRGSEILQREGVRIMRTPLVI